MSVRSFTVFQDSFSEHTLPLDPSPSPADAVTTSLSTLAAIEKENLHPLTGQRAGPTTASETKKRKTAVLATKTLVPPSSKKHKELKPESKKSRKSSSSASKPRSSDAKKSNSRSSRSSRKPSPLPPVPEEHVSHRQPPRLSISQTDIDSRCYELTVSPLADVSEAYDATRIDSQEPDARTQTEDSVEPAVHDHLSPSAADSPLPTTNNASCSIDEPSRQANDFSSPKRNRVHSAFTFSSPSPTSERFKQAQSSPYHSLAASSE